MNRLLRIILVALSITGCASSRYNYITDAQGKIYLTSFNIADSSWKSFTIITYGKWKSKQLPTSYLKVRNTWRDGWQCLIKFNGDTAMIYDPYNYFDEVNTAGTLLKHQKMKDQEFAKIFFDSTNTEYIKLSSK